MTITMTNQKEFIFSKDAVTTLREFDKVFEELFNRTWVVRGVEYNLAKMGWKRGYNTRKRALGLCSYRRGFAGTVFISKSLLSLNLDKAYEFEDTIRHEIAHAIHAVLCGRSSHDYVWKSICREIGADDSRLHEGFLETPKGKYTLKCGTCNYQSEYHRKPTRRKACSGCCNKHSHGRFDPRFELQLTQNY